MAEENQKFIDERKLEASRSIRKAERKMLDDCRDELRLLSDVLTSTGKGYPELPSEVKQNIRLQIASILIFLKRRIKRLNFGWPDRGIRKAKADELRPRRRSQEISISKQKLDSNTLKAFAQKDPRG